MTMTNEEILKKAIKKAQQNGFTGLSTNWNKDGRIIPTFNLIFSHDFAKAFWGEAEHTFLTISGKDVTNDKEIILDFHGAWTPNVKWAYHLQQMVLEEDPIKYLERFLEGKH